MTNGTRGRRSGAAILALLLAGGGLATAATPAPAPAPRPISISHVELDVVERGPGRGPVSMKLLVGLTELGPSLISTQSGGARYKVKLLLDEHRRGGPALVCDLERFEPGAQGTRDAQVLAFKASVPLVRGARLTVGRVQRPDGSQLEVVATAR